MQAKPQRNYQGFFRHPTPTTLHEEERLISWEKSSKITSRKADWTLFFCCGHLCRKSRWNNVFGVQIFGGEKHLEKCPWNTFKQQEEGLKTFRTRFGSFFGSFFWFFKPFFVSTFCFFLQFLSGPTATVTMSRYTVTLNLSHHVFQDSEGCRKRIAPNPLKGPCSTYLFSSWRGCCTSSCLLEGVAVQGGAAATLSPVAL